MPWFTQAKVLLDWRWMCAPACCEEIWVQQLGPTFSHTNAYTLLIQGDKWISISVDAQHCLLKHAGLTTVKGAQPQNPCLRSRPFSVSRLLRTRASAFLITYLEWRGATRSTGTEVQQNESKTQQDNTTVNYSLRWLIKHLLHFQSVALNTEATGEGGCRLELQISRQKMSQMSMFVGLNAFFLTVLLEMI